MSYEPRPQCQFDSCEEESDYWLEARWTIFDFDDFYCCLVHLPRAVRYIQSRLIDGREVVEIEQHAISFWR